MASADAQERQPVTIGFVGLEDDPRLGALTIYTGLVLRPAVEPVDGAKSAVQASRMVGRALKLAFELEPRTAIDAASAEAAVRQLATEKGARFVLLDLPAAMIDGVVRATGDLQVLLFNVSAGDERLRAIDCARHLFHTAPSDGMLTDALAQYLARMGWNTVLLLVGPRDADAAMAEL